MAAVRLVRLAPCGVAVCLEVLERRDVPSSGPFVAADFTGSGVWLHPPEAAWRQLTPADAALMDMAGP